MEAVEFLRNYDRMCSTIDKCSECPAVNMKCCELSTDEKEKLVEIVEKWAKEHPEEPERERQKPDQEQQKPERPEEAEDVTKPKQDEPCVKTIQDQLEGAIYRAIASHKTKIEKLEHDVSVMRNNLAELKDKTHKEQQVEVKKEQSCGNNALEERVDHLKKCFDEMNERLTCFIHYTVDEVQAIKKQAEHQYEFMQTKCVHVDSEEVKPMNEPKRTNKDVLLAAFPDARMDNNGIPDACPIRLDAHYNCDKFENCSRCRHTHWLAEVEE